MMTSYLKQFEPFERFEQFNSFQRFKSFKTQTWRDAPRPGPEKL